MKHRILIAEDDRDIVEVMKLYLESDNIEVIEAEDGEEAYSILKEKEVHMAVVDIMMPKMNGYELIKRMRMDMNMPIIVVSAKNQSADKVLGLNIGADDYITKPFDPLELLARVQSQLRRYYNLGAAVTSEEKKNGEISYKELKMDQESLSVFKHEEKIELTAIEYKILNLLMKSPGKIFTKAQIFETIRGDYYYTDENTLMVHISNLRNKIGDDSKNPRYIKTIRGLGYKIEKE